MVGAPDLLDFIRWLSFVLRGFVVLLSDSLAFIFFLLTLLHSTHLSFYSLLLISLLPFITLAPRSQGSWRTTLCFKLPFFSPIDWSNSLYFLEQPPCTRHPFASPYLSRNSRSLHSINEIYTLANVFLFSSTCTISQPHHQSKWTSPRPLPFSSSTTRA